MSTPTEFIEALGIDVRIVGAGGQNTSYHLAVGDALVIGTSPACGIRLEGAGVAAMHCTLSIDEGQIVVDDWDTGGGTYINDRRIARQAVVEVGSHLRIGSYRVEFVAPEIPADSSSDEAEDILATDRPADDNATISRNPEQPAKREDLFDVFDDVDGWEASPDEAKTEVEFQLPEAMYEISDDSFDEDALELMQIEVEYLRTELAERDARVAELEGSQSGTPSQDDDLPSREEVETLVSRLEDLLLELEHSDERIKSLTELLRASEEVNLAAEEERTQMESWIGEVERRVRDWESEWHAERETMNRKVAELTSQRDAAEAAGGSAAGTATIQKLRDDLIRAQEAVTKLTAERTQLQERISSAEVAAIEDQVAAAVESTLREERLRLSQAQAECARARAEMMRAQEEISSKQFAHSSEPNVADVRIRAFREHLKEIRATEPAARKTPSMSQRLGKLWRKIDGRPLDTD